MIKNTAEKKQNKLFVGAFIPNWLLKRTELSQGAKLCYVQLCQHADKDGKCYSSQETIAKEIGASLRSTKNYIKELKNNELINSKRRGLTKTNVYYFYWHKWMENDNTEKIDT